jgi:hypothetical protein
MKKLLEAMKKMHVWSSEENDSVLTGVSSKKSYQCGDFLSKKQMVN